jgi:hypothetical protein
LRNNVKAFVRVASETFALPEPIYEFGSLQVPGQEAYANLRSFFPGRAYVGCDMREGRGVDRVENVEALTLADETVGTVIMVETLEHTQSPIRAIDETFRALRSGGAAIIISAMNFPIHNYPADYWRYTPECFNYLLRRFSLRTIGAQGDPLNPHTVYGLAFKNGKQDQAIFDQFWNTFKATVFQELERATGLKDTRKGEILRWIASKPPLRRRVSHIIRTLKTVSPESEELGYRSYSSSTLVKVVSWQEPERSG